MVAAGELEHALAEVLASGLVEVHEDGEWLASLTGFQYEVRGRTGATLLHLWSGERNLVRRVLRVAEQTPERLVLEVARFGRSRPGRLEFLTTGAQRAAGRVTRERFRSRFGQLLTGQFPDEQVDSLTTSADLEHSLSGCYTRGLLHRGRQAWAVIGASPEEDASTIDAMLTYGLVWLDRARALAHDKFVAGLRVFLPEGSGRVLAHRLSALRADTPIEIYELQPGLERARRVAPDDLGNLATWLTPRREVEQTLAQARPAVEKIAQLAPEAIRAAPVPGTHEVALRFRGLEFARWQRRAIAFGLDDKLEPLSAQNQPKLAQLVKKLQTFRHPLASDGTHSLYRSQAERWLEAEVQADPARIDARLDPRHLYAQVPAFAAGDRGVIDLLGVTREGRLVVIELKAAEDIHLVLQAADYWLRVRWHHEQDDFHRYGYFPGVELQKKPPLLYLVAPGFRFHPTTDVLLRHCAPEIEVTRIGLNENWRRGLQVIFRQ